MFMSYDPNYHTLYTLHIVPLSQGNTQNQIVVFDCKVIDYINFILRGGQFQNCDLKMVNRSQDPVIRIYDSSTLNQFKSKETIPCFILGVRVKVRNRYFDYRVN